MRTLQFWFDYACPYAYLASTQVEALARRTGARLEWRPMLLGGVFRAIGAPQTLPLSPQKARYLLMDQQRWADGYGVPLTHPVEHPRRTVAALRATLAHAVDPAIVHAFYRAYWVEGRAIEDERVVREIAGDVDLDAQREPLRESTEQAVRLGIFGAPAFVVDGQLWWGNDRLDQVEAALTGERPAAHDVAPAARDNPPGPGQAPPGADAHELDFWFDFSSPFAYLASTQVDALAARTGATLRWRPMLLGAVFSAVGQVNIPIASFSEAKRRYYAEDLARWARDWGVPFTWNPVFPLRTVLPLRAFLAHPEPVAFAHRVFAAAWARGQDISDPAVLRDCGASDTILAATGDQKAALFAETEEALRQGVFGAPTLVVDARHRFWGQDRLGMVERALRGWVPPG